MTRRDLILRVRANTRDFTNSVFREMDIVSYINEGIDRMKQLIRELRDEIYLLDNNEKPLLIPEMYHHILAIYSTAKCFAQDERNYQASTMMNEFEVKLGELVIAIQSGDIIIVNSNNVEVESNYPTDYVEIKSYWGKTMSSLHRTDDEE